MSLMRALSFYNSPGKVLAWKWCLAIAIQSRQTIRTMLMRPEKLSKSKQTRLPKCGPLTRILTQHDLGKAWWTNTSRSKSKSQRSKSVRTSSCNAIVADDPLLVVLEAISVPSSDHKSECFAKTWKKWSSSDWTFVGSNDDVLAGSLWSRDERQTWPLKI